MKKRLPILRGQPADESSPARHFIIGAKDKQCQPHLPQEHHFHANWPAPV